MILCKCIDADISLRPSISVVKKDLAKEIKVKPPKIQRNSQDTGQEARRKYSKSYDEDDGNVCQGFGKISR